MYFRTKVFIDGKEPIGTIEFKDENIRSKGRKRKDNIDITFSFLVMCEKILKYGRIFLMYTEKK